MAHISGKFSTLQDGKMYVTRNLSMRITVSAVEGHESYKFEAEDGVMLFTENGRYLDDDTEHPFDLIEEVILK